MLYKKRWSDGLNQDFDHLDEFEAKFYCFGGDGGGGGGGGGTAKPAPKKTTAQQNKSAASQEPERGGFRGEQSAALDAARANLSSGNTQQNLADKIQDQVGQSVFDSGYYDTPSSQTAPGIADMFPDAVVPSTTISAPAPVDPTKASMVQDLLGQTPMGSIYDLAPIAPVAPPASYTPPDATNPMSLNLGPGTLTPSYDPSTQGFGLNYSMPFSTSSVDQQGIGSLNQQKVMDALTSGINNPQTTTVPTTDVAFLDPQSVFGTLTAPLESIAGTNLVRRGSTYTSRGSGGITSTARQKNMFDKIAGTGKKMADQVGLGSLFD